MYAQFQKTIACHGSATFTVKDEMGRVPLHMSATSATGGERRHDKVTALLLAHRANPNAEDMEGKSVLHYVADCSEDKVVALLLKYGARVNAKNTNGITPLYMTTRRNRASVVVLLLDKGAKVNVVAMDGDTPLHDAAHEKADKVAAGGRPHYKIFLGEDNPVTLEGAGPQPAFYTPPAADSVEGDPAGG